MLEAVQRCSGHQKYVEQVDPWMVRMIRMRRIVRMMVIMRIMGIMRIMRIFSMRRMITVRLVIQLTTVQRRKPPNNQRCLILQQKKMYRGHNSIEQVFSGSKYGMIHTVNNEIVFSLAIVRISRFYNLFKARHLWNG